MKLLIAAVLMLSTSLAMAVPTITVSRLEAVWLNPVGGNITYASPTAPSTAPAAVVRWGSQASGSAAALSQDSGYDFVGRPTSFSEPENTAFAFGSFSHQNNPISAGTSIDSIDLFLTTSFSIDDGFGVVDNYLDVIFGFRFIHDETPNSLPNEYPSGGDYLEAFNGANVNASGSADLVTIEALGTSFQTPDGLTLNLLGFSDTIINANSGNYFSSFLSGEGSTNGAILAASFGLDPAQVPIAGTWALMPLGLFGLALARRRV